MNSYGKFLILLHFGIEIIIIKTDFYDYYESKKNERRRMEKNEK